MSVRLAALAALVAVSAIAWPANTADRLSLDDAFARVAQSHPDLRLFGARQDILAAELDRAALRPALVAGASIDAPGPYDASAPTYYNVTPLDGERAERAESWLREYNRWMLPVLNIHEAVPGHYVQLVYANRSPSLVKSIFGNGATLKLMSGGGGDKSTSYSAGQRRALDELVKSTSKE